MRNSILILALVLVGSSTNSFASDEVSDAFQALQSAESTKDPAAVKDAAVAAYRVADQDICQGEPEDPAAKARRADRVAYDREVQTHAEYALFAAAITASGNTALDLFATLEQVSPKSKYLDTGYGQYFKLLYDSGQKATMIASAERAVKAFPSNPDALLVLADSAMSRKQPERAIAYSKRLVAAVKTRRRPSGVSEAQWQSTRNAMLGRGYWIAGILEAERNDFYEANSDLRAALPLVEANASMTGATLFYLGVSNYNLSREMLNKSQMREAIQFSERAAKLKGNYSQQAWENAVIMKSELEKWR